MLGRGALEDDVAGPAEAHMGAIGSDVDVPRQRMVAAAGEMNRQGGRRREPVHETVHEAR
jgi:hypothetical protein